MPTTYPPEKRIHAETLFVFRQVEIPDLATVTGVSQSQLRRWARDGAWTEKRQAHAASGPMLAGQLQEHIALIVKAANEEARVLTGKEIDAITKLQAMVERHNPAARLVAHVLEGMDWLAAYVREKAPHLMEELAPIISDFGEDLVRTKLGSAG